MRVRVLAIVAAVALVGAGSAALAAGNRDEVEVSRLSRAGVRDLVTTVVENATDPEAATSPATCVEGNDGLWLAPGKLASTTARIECSIPSGAELAVNLGGTLCRVSERSTPSIQALIIDGKVQPEFRPNSTGKFSINVPEGNIFGLPPGPTKFAYIGKDVRIGLPDGTHRVRVLFSYLAGGELAPLDDTTYVITVG
jgi:hypothetical protein